MDTDKVPEPRRWSRGDISIVEEQPDGVLVRDTITPNFRVTFIRLRQGTTPATTLRGEAHIDVAEDGSILGVTIEVQNDARG